MVTVKTVANEDEQSVAVGVLTLAFSSDPMARWSQPDPLKYLEHFPSLVQAFGGNAFAENSGFVADSFAGAALWLPPGVGPDEEGLMAIVNATAPEEIKNDLFGVFDQMDKFHPKEPHWYLPLIGVDPARQGNGVGSALMKRALELCDTDGTIAYLESSNPKNIPLYERHGFKVIGEIQNGSSPTMYPMRREAR